jgi:hypothetical protein
MWSRKYVVDLNFHHDYETNEDEDEKMGCWYDDENEDKLVTYFYKEKTKTREGTLFESVEDCPYAVAIFSIKFEHSHIKDWPKNTTVALHGK